MKSVKGLFLSGLVDFAIDQFPEGMNYIDEDDDDDFDYDAYDVDDVDFSTYPPSIDPKITLDKNYYEGIK
jgi:hypothetical protein